MPRLGGGTLGKSYLVSLSDGGESSSNLESSLSDREVATRRSNSNSALISSPLQSHRLIMPTAPSSLKSSSSLNFNKRYGSSSALPTSSARVQSDSELPYTMKDLVSPKLPHRRVLRAAESGKGSVLPEYSATPPAPATGSRSPKRRQPPNRSQTRSSPSLAMIMNLPRRNAASTDTLPLTNNNHNNNNKNGAVPSPPNSNGHNNSNMSTSSSAAASTTHLPLKQSLRRRTTSTHSDDEEMYIRRGSSSSNRESPYRQSRRNRGGGSGTSKFSLQKLLRMKLGHVLQILIVLAVMLLVFESRHKATIAAQQLAEFKKEESLLLMHLQKIEQQSIQLHENMNRIATKSRNLSNNSSNNLGVLPSGGADGDRGGEGGGGSAADGNNNNNNGNMNNGSKSNNKDKNSNNNNNNNPVNGDGTIDFDLIYKQTQQLYQMESELSHEVRTLQARIQQSARSRIIREFGEGPVQVTLDLDFGEANNNNNDNNNNGNNKNLKQSLSSNASISNRISILLWHDTPHAAWTWLEQIGRHVWDDATFTWDQAHILEAAPSKQDEMGGKLEFVELSSHDHDPWTVGLKDADGKLSMYINLQDNRHFHKYETCVGKVIDGFDALQKLLEVTRNNSSQSSQIRIKTASAMHVTKRDGITAGKY